MADGGAYSQGVPQLQPGLLLAAGVDPRLMRRVNVTQIPVTQADRDHLGVVRNRQLGHMKWLGIAVAIVSIISLLLIAATIANSPAEDRGMMYVGVLPGFVGICMASMSLGLVKVGEKCTEPDETTYCFRCLTICQLITGWVGSMMCLSAFGLAGIWLLVDCASYDSTISKEERKWDFNRCHTNTGTLLALSVFNVIAFSILIFLILAHVCIGGCCYSRAFGIKSQYEVLLDLQTARMMEMQRLQAAQNPGMVNMQAGYQPQQMGPGYQPQFQTGYQSGPQTGYQPQYKTGAQTIPPQQQMGGAQYGGYSEHTADAKHGHERPHPGDRVHDRYHHDDREHGHHEPSPSDPLMNESEKSGEAPPPSYNDIMQTKQ